MENHLEIEQTNYTIIILQFLLFLVVILFIYFVVGYFNKKSKKN